MLAVDGQKAGIKAKEVVLRLGYSLTPTDHLCTEQNLTKVYLSLHGQLCDAVKLSSVSYDNPFIKQTRLLTQVRVKVEECACTLIMTGVHLPCKP